jgi:hypothetical protein
VAAEILAVDRNDLPCMTMLLFAGPASADELPPRFVWRGRVVQTFERLQLAGYARFQPEAGASSSASMRGWIDGSGSFETEGNRLLDSTHAAPRTDGGIHGAGVEVQESRAQKLRSWLSLPSSPPASALARRPVARRLRRVQVFVEANLSRPIHLRDLPRAPISAPIIFARVQGILGHDAACVRRASPHRSGKPALDRVVTISR